MIGLSLRAKKNLFFSLFKNYYLLDDEISFARRVLKTLKPSWHNYKLIQPLDNLALVRNETSDILVFEQIFKRMEYREVIRKYNEIVKHKKEVIIIDAGGNAGYASIYFKNQFNNAKIYLIEPDNDNFELCIFNMRLNNFSNVKCVKRGLWGDRKTNLTISKDFRDGKEWSLSVRPTTELKESIIKSISILDIVEICSLSRIDILKIDIEGAEKFVFEDEKHVSDFLSKTLLLCIEIHEEIGVKQQILNLLKINGFEYYDYYEFTIGYNISNINRLS